jgi:hypothetical protein
MFDGDLVCRSALFPKFLSNQVFATEALLNFTKIDDGRVYALSVGSRFLLRTDEGAHGYGCQAARLANKRFVEKNGRPPAPLTEKVHYLGFYDLACGHVRSLELDHYDLEINWRPEHDSDAHFQVEFHRRPSQASDRQRRQDRTAAIAVLADMLSGPKRHICDGDQDVAADLSEIVLPELSPA